MYNQYVFWFEDGVFKSASTEDPNKIEEIGKAACTLSEVWNYDCKHACWYYAGKQNVLWWTQLRSRQLPEEVKLAALLIGIPI